ncbi:EAL domain-containing protein [Henriciella sp.]|uniref:putative bifunctional diguanylate cyclase/phosphodiesterase n=1 Tax=Henriciella sp. TaxID=1968823 RepID=UPI001854BF1F|nr:EAL domain-containing protein [Henriciella sp.]HIG21333.1 EAL domain-containing protein [Henriciella sp.]
MQSQADRAEPERKPDRESSWSFARLRDSQIQQLLVLFCASAILLTMAFVIISMALAGGYPLGVMAIVDGATALGLVTAIILALRRKSPRLQILLVCMSIPANLFAEILLQGAGAWPALLLIGLSPFMLGLLAPIWLTSLYTAGLIGFYSLYLAGLPGEAVTFAGHEETYLTAIALSVIASGSALAAILPKKVTGAAFASLDKAARQESALKKRYADYATLASDWHLEIDEFGIVTDFLGPGHAAGCNWRTLFYDWEEQAHVFNEALKTRAPYENIRANMRVGTLSRRVEVTGQPISHPDGGFAGYRVIARDITDKAEAEEKLKVLAMCDRLTGLKNRHAFNEAVEARLSQTDGQETAVICIDLDNFKNLNDRQGHECGDAALAELGRRFREFEEAIPGLEVFRLGGDEFCALLSTQWDPQRIHWLAEQFAEAVSRPIPVDNRLIDMAASIGAACTGPNKTLANALERADAAVYEAKSLGGGQCILCTGEIEVRLERRLAIRRDLAAAIANGDIRMRYQPIFEVRSGALSGVEALARWNHPVYGAIAPDEFITIAESSRSIVSLGQYTLRRSCIEALDWMKRHGASIQLNVNISPMEITSDGFIDSLLSILTETGFPAELLELEITERGMFEDVEVSRSRLNTIREHGVGISLDDFGTGYSSLSRLESLPIDRIKVDRSFLTQAVESQRAQKLLALMSGIGGIMDVEIVAEGIETEDQLRLVRLAGFSKVQGYLLGRPAPIEDLDASNLQAKQHAPELRQSA